MSDAFAALGDMSDEELHELIELEDGELNRRVLGDNWDQQDVRDFVEDLGDYNDDWQGVPVPLSDDMPVIVQPRHPMAEVYAEIAEKCKVDDGLRDGETIVNKWLDQPRNRMVYILDFEGRREAVVVPLAPDRSMDRLDYWLRTLGASDAWNLEAEHVARERLRGMLTERQWRHYDLTGAFIETSERSKITYVFRRLRPTIAMSPRGRNGSVDTMHVVAVLCMHPIGYYANTWAGCMVPSDDVIAHLAMMRGDEPRYWAKAIQHRPHEAEAGL